MSDGLIRMAIREGQTLGSVAAEQRERDVHAHMDIEYAERLDGVCGERRIEWSLPEVSGAFRQGVLNRFSSLRDADTPQSSDMDACINWIRSRDRLNYRDLLTWWENASNASAARDSAIAIGSICYRTALPRVLGLSTAEPSDPAQPEAYFDLGEERLRPLDSLPVWSLRPDVLAALPAEFIIQMRNQGAIRQTHLQLHFLQTNDGRFSEALLMQALREIVFRLDAGATLFFEGRARAAMKLTQTPRRLRIRIGKAGHLGNGLLLLDVSRGLENLASPHGVVSLLLAASGIASSTIADRNALQNRENQEIELISTRQHPDKRLIKSVDMSRAVIPTLG